MNLAFIGSKYAGFKALEQTSLLVKNKLKVIICPNDLNDHRNEQERFKDFAITVHTPIKIVEKSKDLYSLLEKYEIDIAIVVGWYSIIDIVKAPNTKFYGIHYSLLPKYRGNAPLVWQIINGEKKIGISFFEIVEGMDEGDIIGQDSFNINIENTIKDALNLAQKSSISLLQKFLPELIAGQKNSTSQNHSEASYCGMRLPKDGRIDWNKSATQIHNFIRAQSQPYPGAFSYLENEKVIILKSKLDPRTIFAVPGSIMERKNNYVVIGCAEGAIQIYSISVNGDCSIKPRDFFNSLKNRLK